jgi:uncharacterized protein (TIGR03663 family)
MTKTYSRARRRQPREGRISSVSKKAAIQPEAPASRERFQFRTWQGTALGILIGAAVLRLIDLSGPVLHHDEGVNGSFLATLFRTGFYRYDPQNYHGPTLYYFAWITTTINSLFFGRDGLSTFAIRLVTVIFGLGVVWLLLCLRRQLGDFGSLAAAALAAVSAGFVFFSRYFIHEILFVFFSLGIVVAWQRFRQTRRPRYLMLASASAALMGATKETWVITAAVWLLAILGTQRYASLRGMPEEPSPPPGSEAKRYDNNSPESPEDVRWNNVRLYATAALVFVAVWVTLYSSFFTNFPQGVFDSVATFGPWFKTSSSAHTYSWKQYLAWLWNEEAPILILGGLGLAIVFGRASSRWAVFCAFWAAGILAAYSLVPYKTPWLALNILLPFILVAGYGLEELYRRMRWLAVALLLGAAGVCLYGAVDLSFYRYDDDREPYVYAHTYRDLLAMVDEINSIAAGNPRGKDIGITLMTPEHWPLPWYLRDYKNAGYWGKVVDTTEPILIVHENQVPEVERKFGDKYRLIRTYELRPGNRLYLYLRRDVQR